MTLPLAIDLFCGLHGWAEGLVAEGYEVLGYDLEDMCAQFNQPRPPHVELIVQDVLTLHGSQFRDAALIVASPPCQRYSWMAMPWKHVKARAAAIRADESGEMLADLNRLFDACFRIQREACEAAGRHIPMVVENVRGAQPWVGRARWNFGSFYLWGDVPALMPMAFKAQKFNPDGTAHPPGSWFAIADSKNRGGKKLGGGANVPGIGWTGFADTGASWRNREIAAGIKQHGSGAGGWFGEYRPGQPGRSTSSSSVARKFASAMIAKIPLPLSRHIARVYHPDNCDGPVALAPRPLFDMGRMGNMLSWGSRT